MNVSRPVWGFLPLGRELRGVPDEVQARFLQLWHDLGERDVAPDHVWRLHGHIVWVYECTSERRMFRTVIEVMPGGWIMVWAQGPAATVRRRLDQRLVRIGSTTAARRAPAAS